MKVWKLVSGILSIILFVFVSFQSCAAGVSNALEANGEASGSAGIIVAILMCSILVKLYACRWNCFNRYEKIVRQGWEYRTHSTLWIGSNYRICGLWKFFGSGYLGRLVSDKCSYCGSCTGYGKEEQLNITI